MKVKYSFVPIALMMAISSGYAQNKLTEEDIISTATRIENDWQFGYNHVIWMEDADRFSHYLQTVPLRCPYELELVVDLSKRPYEENQQILQLKQKIYPQPGSKKSENNLAKYFTDTEKAKQRFEAAEEAVQMYQQLIKEATPIIEAKNQRKFTIPQGELTYFYYHLGGGMINRPAAEATLRRQKDGTYLVALDTYKFHQLDTISVTQAQVDTIRQMLIEGEVYKMPAYYDEPMRILDAPSGSVAIKFTDVSFNCNNLPPLDWGGKNIRKVYEYLKSLQPKREMTEEERMLYY